MFRKHNASVRVVTGQRCASACADAFVGGIYRTIDGSGHLLVHRAYEEINGRIICDTDDSFQLSYYNSMLPSSTANRFNRAVNSRCSKSNLKPIHSHEEWIET